MGLNCEDCSILKITATQLVFKGPGYLVGAYCNGDGAAGEVDLYDGIDTAGKHLYRINVGQDIAGINPVRYPVPLDMGLYVVINAATTHVTVQWVPRRHAD